MLHPLPYVTQEEPFLACDSHESAVTRALWMGTTKPSTAVGQGSALQCTVLEAGPSQSLPPLAGKGSEQVLVLWTTLMVCGPQGAEQPPCHSDHPPSFCFFQKMNKHLRK